MWFKMCPRCRGDLYVREDLATREIVCIQCSLILSPQQERELVWHLHHKRMLSVLESRAS